MTKTRIRVLCVDDHRLVREGIAFIIGRQPDMEVVGAAVTGQEAVALFLQHRPDVTLMDLQLGRMTGVDAIEAIRGHDGDARIIVLTTLDGDQDIHRALRAGAATYLLKDMLSGDLIRVIRDVHAGKRPIEPEVQARMAEHATDGTLTPREVEVIELVIEGMRNKEIAASLSISEETVLVHLRNIFSKLKVNGRTNAAIVALRRGIVHLR